MSANKYATEFQSHLNIVGHYMFDMMFRQVQLIKLLKNDHLVYMRAEYHKQLMEFYSSYIFRVQQKTESLAANLDSQLGISN